MDLLADDTPRYTSTLFFRLAPRLKKTFKQLAKMHNLNTSEYLRRLIVTDAKLNNLILNEQDFAD